MARNEEKTNGESARTVERDDPLDLGVPMLPSEGNERVGPEDALGRGPKRGDYTNRLGGAIHTEAVRVPEDERETDEDGNVVGAHTKIEHQNPRAEEIGDEEGLKGGVETDPAHGRIRR